MSTLSLDYEEFQQVCHLCHWLHPGFDLKHFLVGHLKYKFPATASKIEKMDEDKISILRQEVAAHQKLHRMGPRDCGMPGPPRKLSFDASHN